MNTRTQEAIEFLVKEKIVYENTPLESGYESVINILQRGEKYEAMWKSVETAKINDKGIQRAIRILISDIKKGYREAKKYGKEVVK